MGYALFAQRKLVLDSQLNSTQLQQTQRSNEQYQLATNALSLQQKLSSLQANQAFQLQPLYEKLAGVSVDTAQFEGEEGFDTGAYNEAMQEERAKIETQIQALQNSFKMEEDAINREIYVVEVKENAIEMEVKRLDTQVAALQKQLESVEEAEGDCINRATPKFKGAA